MFETAVAELQTTYNTVGPFYLSRFFQPGGEKTLYDFLKSVYRPAYENNFKILVVQDCNDEYNYENLPGRAIVTLQKYASEIDISNFFILVITDNKNIDQELEQVRQSSSTDDCAMQSLLIESDTYKIEYKKSDTFCVLPWMHLYVGTDGNVLPCCSADQDYPMGSIEKDSIGNILKSESFNQLRSNMLNNMRSKECSRCYAQEDQGIVSSRQKVNKKWQDLNITFSETLDSFTPLELDIRLNNICNLRCRMCSGYFSSAIAQEEKELFGNPISALSAMKLRQRNLSIKEILDYVPDSKSIYFAGGEPLIASEHYDILNKLIKANNTDLKIFYNTNFTTLQFRNTLVTDMWNKFSDVTVAASLDAIGPVAEYIRHGTQWNAIESNLAQLKEQCPHVNFKVASTLGFLNATSLIELQKTWHTQGILDISKFSLSVMVAPTHLILTTLPEKHKKRLSTSINTHIKWCQKNNADQVAEQWSTALNFMMTSDTSQFLDEFKRLTDIIDTHRKQSLKQVLPEFKDLV